MGVDERVERRPADVVFDFGGGSGGRAGAGAVFVWGITTPRNPVSGFGFGSAIRIPLTSLILSP
jgi:hypothetical protein